MKPRHGRRTRVVVLATLATGAALLLSSAAHAAPPNGIQILKTADMSSVNAGDPIGFTIKVSNSGRPPANVFVTDNLPTNPGTSWSMSPAVPGCAISSTALNCFFRLGSGASTLVHIVSPTTTATCASPVNNTATASSNVGGGTSSASITVNCAHLNVTKTPDNPTVTAGDQVGYFIAASNNGSASATNVRLTDALPSGLTWALASPDPTCSITASGGSQTLTCGPESLATNQTIQAHIVAKTSPANCPSITNTASASATNAQSASSGPVTINVTCLPDLVVQSIAFTPGATPDGYTVTIANHGDATADLSGVGVQGYYSTAAGLWSGDPACGQSVPLGTTLAQGGTYALVVGCSLAAPPGDGWLVVKVDTANVVTESDETNNIGSVSLFSGSLGDDGACLFTADATWHNTSPDSVLVDWYVDNAFIAAGVATISGDAAEAHFGPLTPTTDTHAIEAVFTFLTGTVNDGSVATNVDTANCGLFSP